MANITKSILLSAAIVVVLGIFFRPAVHSEDALLSDWSAPPPWPIFIALNMLSGILRSMADAITPPPVRVIDFAFAYKTSRLLHLCQVYGIADFLAGGPKTIAQIAKQHTRTHDYMRVERIMYAMAADGITKLDPSRPKNGSTEPRFVNSALSATRYGWTIPIPWQVWWVISYKTGTSHLVTLNECSVRTLLTFPGIKSIEMKSIREARYGNFLRNILNVRNNSVEP